MANAGISLEPIDGSLMLLPVRPGEARLVWNFQIHTLDKQHMWDLTVDADTGQVWTRFDWVAGDQYRVYPRPVESPNHTTPLPPADGRTLVVNPANALASPFGWHDTNGAAGAESTLTHGQQRPRLHGHRRQQHRRRGFQAERRRGAQLRLPAQPRRRRRAPIGRPR